MQFELDADQAYDAEMEDQFPNAVQYLYSISTVCSVWRALALSLPELWTNIMVFPGSSRRSAESTISLLDAYLDRSGNASLRIILRSQPLNFKISFNLLAAIWGMLSLHLHRCRHLTLVDATVDGKAFDLFFPFQNMAPSLGSRASG